MVTAVEESLATCNQNWFDYCSFCTFFVCSKKFRTANYL